MIETNVRKRMADIMDVSCDFAADFARHIPLDTICDLMGVDDQTHRDNLYSLGSTALSWADRNATAEQCAIARTEILMLFAETVERRRTRLGDDLISDLIRLEDTDVKISSEEILYNCYSLFLGGNEEPRFAIAGMLKALAENHGEWMRLKNGQVSVRGAVEEILRWTTPVLHLARSVVSDVVVGGTPLKAGQIASLWNNSANSDEEVFVDAHRLILDRPNNAHMSFGFGNHFCLGASLARMELSAVATALVNAVDSIEITGAARPVYSNFVSGVASLPGQLKSHRTGAPRDVPRLEGRLEDVAIEFFNPEAQDLLFIRPTRDDFEPLAWLQLHKEPLSQILSRHGAMVFRNFGINSVADFNKAALAIAPALQDYVNRSTPRTRLGGKIYTATEYPHDRRIPLHNENSYTDAWPTRILFYSAIVAAWGGETIVADSRRIYSALDQEIRRKFEKKGVLYVRNYTPGIDLSWQEVFQTENRSEVASFCQCHRIEAEWRPGTPVLTTRQKCQATLRHPTTGEWVWFNQAHLFHLSALELSEQDLLTGELGLDNVPRNAFYGDGEPIEARVLSHIREVLDRETITFQWHRGDIMLLDNVLFAHGRNPFSGTRKVAVAMA